MRERRAYAQKRRASHAKLLGNVGEEHGDKHADGYSSPAGDHWCGWGFAPVLGQTHTCSIEHVGILAHSVEGAALCLRAFAAEGFRELGPHAHPDVTLDCIALADSMPAWEAADY